LRWWQTSGSSREGLPLPSGNFIWAYGFGWGFLPISPSACRPGGNCEIAFANSPGNASLPCHPVSQGNLAQCSMFAFVRLAPFVSTPPTILRFLAVFSGIRRAAKHQAPNTKLHRKAPNPRLKAPEKFQGPNFNARPGWPPHRSDLGLELEIWSFVGAWCLGLGAFRRTDSIESEKPISTLQRFDALTY